MKVKKFWVVGVVPLVAIPFQLVQLVILVFFFRSTVGSRSFGGNSLSSTEDVSGKVGDDILLLNGLGKASLPTKVTNNNLTMFHQNNLKLFKNLFNLQITVRHNKTRHHLP